MDCYQAYYEKAYVYAFNTVPRFLEQRTFMLEPCLARLQFKINYYRTKNDGRPCVIGDEERPDIVEIDKFQQDVHVYCNMLLAKELKP